MDWDKLYIEYMTLLAVEGVKLDGTLVTIKEEVIFLREHKLHSGRHSIINILLFLSTLSACAEYFRNVALVLDWINVTFYKRESILWGTI